VKFGGIKMGSGSNSLIRTIISGSAWSFVGVLIAVAFFYWQEYRNPFDFRVELVDEFNLVEVKEKISDLKIIYKNDDILSSKKEIKVVRINLNNAGETILQSCYDQLEPFGLRFLNSKILNAEVISSNSEDLKEKLIEKFSSESKAEHDDLIFSKVIFDKGDLVSLKVTVLQSANKDLIVKPLGKLANIERLEIRTVKDEERKPVSPVTYIFGAYFGFIFLLIGLIAFIDFYDKHIKKKKVRKYKEEYEVLHEAEEEIISLYLNIDQRIEKIISGLLDDDFVIDFKDIIKKYEQPHIFNFLFPFLSRRKARFRNLPKAIFNVQGSIVTFNTKNLEFIKSFFGEVL